MTYNVEKNVFLGALQENSWIIVSPDMMDEAQLCGVSDDDMHNPLYWVERVAEEGTVWIEYL